MLATTYWNLGENRAKITEIMDKEQGHARSCFEKKSAPIDTTRKYDFSCNVAFNRKFDYDDVIKMKNECIFLVENCINYNISKCGRKSTTGK